MEPAHMISSPRWRAHGEKKIARVYDYADTRVPVLRAMHARRLATYKALGFTGERTDSRRVGQQLELTRFG